MGKWDIDFGEGVAIAELTEQLAAARADADRRLELLQALWDEFSADYSIEVSICNLRKLDAELKAAEKEVE